MTVITLTHALADGTLTDGTSRGDAAGPILHAHGFRFSRTIDLWYLPHSRDKRANTALIERTASALRTAGFSVETSVDDDATRSFADAEAERAERAEERADARYRTGRDMLDRIPLGQPILIAHHSEGADRRYRNRAVGHLDKSAEESGKSEHWQRRADAAASHQAGRENIGTTLRRIAKLEAQERFWANTLKTGRNSAGWTTTTPEQVEEINRRLADVREQLAYWRELIAAAEQAGHKIWSKSDFTRGDFALSRGRWHQVMRVNTKTVTVPYLRDAPPVLRAEDPSFLWTATIPYSQIDGRKTAQEIAETEQRPTTSHDGQTT